MASRLRIARPLIVLAAALLLPISADGQDRLRSMPAYERYSEMRPQVDSARNEIMSGALIFRQFAWAEDGASFEYMADGQRFRYDIAKLRADAVQDGQNGQNGQNGQTPQQAQPAATPPVPWPARGRQFEVALSPDGQTRAFYRDRNVWLSDADGRNERQITSGGNEAGRIKYGTASWVYGEELRQLTAMWWSPDGQKLAFYRFDESQVADYYLLLDQTQLQSRIHVEPYPKAGTNNPVVDVLVHDLRSGNTVRIDVRDGDPFTNDVVGHYIYGVGWSHDGTELTFNRTNRRQNTMEFAACDPQSGVCRVIVREEWLPSWTTNSPEIRFLEDGQRFVWASERTGFNNYYLYDWSGREIAAVTNHEFEVQRIVHLDESAGVLYYTARSGDNHMKLQLHRVGLDGQGDVRLTDPAFNHMVNMAPDGRHFVVVSMTNHTPPVTRLADADGRILAELATSDTRRFQRLGLQPVEMFTFTAVDGVTVLHGELHKPSNFDPSRTYPVLFSVYGAPGFSRFREFFMTPDRETEYGFLVVDLDSRSTGGRGRRLQDAIYRNMGVVDVDDFAAGIRALHDRPYVDADRVGVIGSSYGGYMAVMALLRYPDLFHAAVAMNAVTDWKHYDTIWTERYMGLPQENEDGYRAGSAMQYAADLRGRLMLYFGTADDNVHPSNSMQLIAALQEAGKSFDLQIGPDRDHDGAVSYDRMMEFLIDNLMLKAAN
jgi:dipeptidyl-peptidase 4